MLPSLFSESAVTLPMDQDSRSPSSEGKDTDSFASLNPKADAGLSEKLREMHLDTGSSTSASGTATNGENDNGSIPSQEGASIVPDGSNFLERYRHENKWFALKNKPIPSTRPEIDEWADEWLESYHEGIQLEIPRFINDGSRMAILDFLAAVELQDAETFGESFLKECRVKVEQSEMSKKFKFDFILHATMVTWPETKEVLRISKADGLDGTDDATAADPKEQEEKKKYNAVDMYLFRRDWYGLLFGNIPTKKSVMDSWIEQWRLMYQRGVGLNIPAFIDNDAEEAKYAFIYRVQYEPGYSDFFEECLYDLLSGPFFKATSFIGILCRFETTWNRRRKTAEKAAAEEEEKRRCVCGLKNHQKWTECYYLNERIRPEGWIPWSKYMARIDELAQTDKKLRKFIQNHKLKPLYLKEIKEQHDPNVLHVSFPNILADLGEIETFSQYRDSFLLLHDTLYHICNDRDRFMDFTFLDPSRPENVLNYCGPQLNTMAVHGVGTVKIRITTPEGKSKGRSLIVHDVKYCPDAPCSGLSAQRAMQSGMYWDRPTDTLYVQEDGERKNFAKVVKRDNYPVLEYNLPQS